MQSDKLVQTSEEKKIYYLRLLPRRVDLYVEIEQIYEKTHDLLIFRSIFEQESPLPNTKQEYQRLQ
jgi:hypothetical protein